MTAAHSPSGRAARVPKTPALQPDGQLTAAESTQGLEGPDCSSLSGRPDEVMTLSEVAAVMRISVAGVYGKLWRGTMLPVPIAEHPYRWNRDDIERWKRGEFREAEATLRKKAKLRGSLRRRVG